MVPTRERMGKRLKGRNHCSGEEVYIQRTGARCNNSREGAEVAGV